MPPLPPPSLFIASLGNPGHAYALTRHSAGHVVLAALANHLDSPASFTSGPDGALTTNGYITLPVPRQKGKKRKRVLTPQPDATSTTADAPDAPALSSEAEQALDNARERQEPPPAPVAHWTLWQSPSFMNESGPALRRAWRTHRAAARFDGDGSVARLVVLHDSLEHERGVVAVRSNAGQLSAKGHNGVKSVVEAFDSQAARTARKARRSGGGGGGVPAGGDDGVQEGEWTKISIGIGRPNGRHPEEVSRYVLSRFEERELDTLRNKTTRAVLEALKGIK